VSNKADAIRFERIMRDRERQMWKWEGLSSQLTGRIHSQGRGGGVTVNPDNEIEVIHRNKSNHECYYNHGSGGGYGKGF